MKRTRVALPAIAGGHFLVEWYTAFFSPLVPIFRSRLGFSLAAAAALGASLPIIAGLVQTIFGLLSDRLGRASTLIAASSVLAAISLALLPLVHTFPTLLALYAAAALSSAMFHPQAASSTSRLSATNSGRLMSVFNVGGSMGTFVGSLTVIPLFNLLHLERFWILAVPGLLLAAFQSFALPREDDPKQEVRQNGEGRIADTPHFRGYLVLLGVAMLTAVVWNGASVLLPLLFQERGFDPGRAGTFLAVASLAGTIANMIGAELSDHIGRKGTNLIGAIGMAVSMLVFVLTRSGSLVGFAAVGFFCSFTLSSNIVFAHELVTNHRGLVSSSIMGLSWGIGGLVVVLLGQWAQHTSIASAYRLLIAAAVLPAGLTFFLPSRHALRTSTSLVQ